MDADDKSMLREIKATVSQNNEMLKKIVQYQKVALWSKFAYWAFFILLALGAFAILKPVLKTLGNVYGVNEGGLVDIFNNSNTIKEFKEQIQ